MKEIIQNIIHNLCQTNARICSANMDAPIYKAQTEYSHGPQICYETYIRNKTVKLREEINSILTQRRREQRGYDNNVKDTEKSKVISYAVFLMREDRTRQSKWKRETQMRKRYPIKSGMLAMHESRSRGSHLDSQLQEQSCEALLLKSKVEAALAEL